MARPQIEDGYLKIANELWDALIRIRIPGEARQVLDVIMRMTYGYNRTWADISLSKFQAMTGLAKPHICHVIKLLITMQIIIINKGNDKPVRYRIQKDYTRWKPLLKKVNNPKGRPLPKKATDIINKGNNSLLIKATTIINKGNATSPKPTPVLNPQDPKDNLKDNKKRQLKDKDAKPVDNSLSEDIGLEQIGKIINKKIKPENPDLEPV